MQTSTPAATATPSAQSGEVDTSLGSVVDLFCGAGGLTHGLRNEGFQVCAGVDVDEQCRFPFEANNAATFLNRDVVRLTASELEALFAENGPRILVGCAIGIGLFAFKIPMLQKMDNLPMHLASVNH